MRGCKLLALAAVAVVFLAPAGLAHAQLDPPAGPIVKTGKTLTEVEPRTAINATNTPGDADSLFKITQSGSYYLTGNITGVAGKHGIEITSSGVTIDLNGFVLEGVPGSLSGISTSLLLRSNIAVRNGVVRSWAGNGVDLSFVTGCTIEGLQASQNAENGIWCGVGLVAECIASLNGDDGIAAGNRGAVRDCAAFENTGRGISGGAGMTVTGCAAYDNGDHGIILGTNSVVSNSTASLNSGYGIALDNASVATNCTAAQNSLSGFNLGEGAVLVDSSSISNSVHGVSAENNCTITNVTSMQNSQMGIVAISACIIEACTARLNTQNGISVASSCTVRGNTLVSNGAAGDGAGILCTSGDNVVDGNTCIANDRGIDVDGIGNLVVRNSCTGNTTNYDLVANNRYGPIVSIPASGTAAATGSSAVSTLSTTDPWANFAY